MWIYLNDRFVEEKDAVVSVFDHGFLYGDGVFETLRAYRGRVLELSEHLERLKRSAAGIQLALPWKAAQLAALVGEAITRNGLQDAYVRITVSRGDGEFGLDPSLCKVPTLVIVAKRFHPPPAAFYRDGVAVAVVHTRRNLSEALPAHVKSLNFLNNILAKIEARAAGAHEGLMLNHRDELTEGTTSNVFLVQEGRLRTPALQCGVLDGITRSLVLRLAGALHLPWEEARLTVQDLYAAQECFLTNTTQEVLPVTLVDGRPVGTGLPGVVTSQLQQLFHAWLDRFLDNA